jgi:hypothetical protein
VLTRLGREREKKKPSTRPAGLGGNIDQCDLGGKCEMGEDKKEENVKEKGE